jgi:hypothetical protein
MSKIQFISVFARRSMSERWSEKLLLLRYYGNIKLMSTPYIFASCGSSKRYETSKILRPRGVSGD